MTGEPTSVPEQKPADAKRLIRGSSLLTIGRLIAILLNFAVQVITVRCLVKADYGSFAYGLAVVSMGASMAVFGLGRMLNRFAPMFQEQKQYGRMAGAIALTLGCVAGIGVGIVLLVIGLQGFIGGSIVRDPLSLSLILILIVLTPMRALDSIFEELFAAFANPRELFVRRHLLGPVLKLAAVTPLMFLHSDVRILAMTFVAFGAIGTTYSAVVLWKVFRRANLLQYFRRDQIKIPGKQLFGFSLPLLSTDALVIVRTSLVTMVLEFCHGALAVAAYRAVFPVARLNMAVADSFRMLFMPTISRLFARGELRSIDQLFWKSATWIAVATFPFVLICTCLSEPVTVLLFGSEYADSAPALALLAAGFYLSAVTGLNGEVLKAHGHVGKIFRTDMITIMTAVILTAWLVKDWGVTGGCITTVVVLLVRPIGNQLAIRRLGLLTTTDWTCVRLFCLMLVIALAAWGLPEYLQAGLVARVATVLGASLAVLVIALPVLDVRNMFPELEKLRLFRRVTRVEQK